VKGNWDVRMIRLEEVHKRFGDQKVLDGLSLEIQAGTVTTIIGRSGGGKSVLMRQMIGLEKPDSGAIYFNDDNIVGMNASELNRLRRRFGVLFQDAALFDSLTVAENVAFPLKEHLKLPERKVAEIVEEKLAKVGMKNHREKFPGALSGGMRKRVGLARALALDPEIVFFDEPTSGLDPVTKGVIYRLILDTHRERSITYVLVSHDIQGVLKVSDEIMMLFNGKISAKGTPQEIMNSSDPVIRQFISGAAEGPITVD
jgi:phospholipid/cholesterol/gamma-HCH transport system ATP-binding protein